MISNIGDFAEDATVYIMFNTYTSNDPSASSTITNFINTDVHIHKDDGLAARNNAAGITVSVDFDGITGSHMIKIDTSDDTVAGFWIVGHDYFVRIEGTTIDGATINSVVGQFSIENRFKEVTVTSIAANAITAASINADAITAAKIADNAIAGEHLNATACTKIIDDFETQSQADPTGFHVNVLEVNGTGQTANDNGADINAILIDTDELQGDWVNGGRLDLIQDIIAADTTTDIPATITTLLTRLSAVRAGYLDELAAVNIPADIDTLLTRVTAAVALASVCTDARLGELDGANLPTDIANIKAETALIVADTNELQTDWKDGGRLDLILDIIAADTTTDIPGTITTMQGNVTDILADTNELQLDWVNGGRLDLLLDRVLTATEIRQAAVNDVGATSTVFITNLAEADNDFWNRGALVFTSGNNAGQMRKIHDYDGATKTITLYTALNAAPANADTFIIVPARNFRINLQDLVDINTEVATALSDIKLDHLVAVADGDDPVNNSIVAMLAASDGDWSGFAIADDSLEALRDRGDAAWTTGAGGTPPTTLQNTTIAALASQTNFTITAGSADDDAYNGCIIVIEDSLTATQKCVGRILNYIGVSKTVILEADPAVFVMANGDTVDIIAVEKTWEAATKALTDKADFALSAASIDAILDEVIGDAVHATPNSVGAMLHAVYCRFMQKRTATDGIEKAYKLDDVTELKAFNLADDGTTSTRT